MSYQELMPCQTHTHTQHLGYNQVLFFRTTPVSLMTPNKPNPSNLFSAASSDNCNPCSRHKIHPGRRMTNAILPCVAVFCVIASCPLIDGNSCVPTDKSNGIREVSDHLKFFIVGVSIILSGTMAEDDDASALATAALLDDERDDIVMVPTAKNAANDVAVDARRPTALLDLNDGINIIAPPK
jgi:hypothetical protein